MTGEESSVTNVIRATRNAHSIHALHFLCLVRRLTRVNKRKARTRTVRNAIRRIDLSANFIRQLHPFTRNFVQVLPGRRVCLFGASTVNFRTHGAARLGSDKDCFRRLIGAKCVFSNALPRIPRCRTRLGFLFRAGLFNIFLCGVVVSSFFCLDGFALALYRCYCNYASDYRGVAKSEYEAVYYDFNQCRFFKYVFIRGYGRAFSWMSGGRRSDGSYYRACRR